jgi:hypothetical protein
MLLPSYLAFTSLMETSPPGMILVSMEALDRAMLGSDAKATKQPINQAGLNALEMSKEANVIEG